MKLKYDAKADRMRLQMAQENQPERMFWLKRNQCLALLARLSDIAAHLGVDTQAADLPDQPPPRTPGKDPAFDKAVPEHLDGIRVRVDGTGVRVIFVQAKDGVALKLTIPGMRRLQDMLTTQAERAGWDPAAGMQRLKAMAEARAAIDRSKDDDDH